MHLKIIILFLTLISCSSNRIGIIGYEDFDHVDYVNEALDRTGVKLNLSEEYSNGKGILEFQDLNTAISDSIFTIVSVKKLSTKSLIITNEVPTADGMFVLTTEVDEHKQKTTFVIQKWPTPKLYKTTFSRLTLALKPNELGFVSGKVEYHGKSDHDRKEIRLVNNFYFK